MRLAGPVFEKYGNPDEWLAALKRLGYSAAYCPAGTDADDVTVSAYAAAADVRNRASVLAARMLQDGANGCRRLRNAFWTGSGGRGAWVLST